MYCKTTNYCFVHTLAMIFIVFLCWLTCANFLSFLHYNTIEFFDFCWIFYFWLVYNSQSLPTLDWNHIISLFRKSSINKMWLIPMLFYCFMIKFLLKMAGRNYRSSGGMMNNGWAVSVYAGYHICISVGISPELEITLQLC